MNIEILGITVLWIFLFGYILVGSIDFGAGFFNAHGIMTGSNTSCLKSSNAIYHQYGK